MRHSLMSSHFPVALLRMRPTLQASNPTQLKPMTSFPLASRPFCSEGRFWHCLIPHGFGAGLRPVSASNSHSLISMQPLGPYPSPRYPFGHGSHSKPLPHLRGRDLRSVPQSGTKFLHLTFGEHAATAREHSSTSQCRGVQEKKQNAARASGGENNAASQGKDKCHRTVVPHSCSPAYHSPGSPLGIWCRSSRHRSWSSQSGRRTFRCPGRTRPHRCSPCSRHLSFPAYVETMVWRRC